MIAIVVEGRLEARLEGHGTVLEVGDTIAFSPADPHSWDELSDHQPAAASFFGMPAAH